MKAGGRRLAERWLWRKRVLGSCCVADEAFDLRSMAVVTEIIRIREVKVMMVVKMAILLGLNLRNQGGESVDSGWKWKHWKG